MEKLDLQKFNDYKLDKKQLSFIHAGDSETQGGTNVERSELGLRDIYSYDSDYINSSGAVFYNNYTYQYSYDGHLRFHRRTSTLSY